MLPLAMLDGGQALQVGTHLHLYSSFRQEILWLPPQAASWNPLVELPELQPAEYIACLVSPLQAALAMNRWELGPLVLAGLDVPKRLAVRTWSVRICTTLVVFLAASHVLRLIV